MSSKRALDYELSLVQREAILRLYLGEGIGGEGIDMSKGGGHVEAATKVSLELPGHLQQGLTNSRAIPLLGSCIAQVYEIKERVEWSSDGKGMVSNNARQ
jgi:hypothetical protein